MQITLGTHLKLFTVTAPLIVGFALAPVTAALAQLAPSPSVTAGQRVPVVSVTLTRFGPFPKSLSVQPKPFFLFVLNRSGVLEDTFSLLVKPAAASAAGPSLLDLHSRSERRRDSKLVELLPGEYELRFAAHPGWSVEVTVTAREGVSQ